MKNIKSYAREELADLFEEWGQPRFRVQQIVKWLYQRGVTSYDEMTDMPKTLRARLAEQAPLNAPELLDKRVSRDGTRKYVWTFEDGKGVETVAIPSRERNMNGEPQRLTVCFSTQVGCAMECAFCATGKEGFSRNLTPGEMVDQILFSGKDMDMRVSNVVAMGQGEPFLNYDNTLAALRFINSKDGLHIGARHITVSTCGGHRTLLARTRAIHACSLASFHRARHARSAYAENERYDASAFEGSTCVLQQPQRKKGESGIPFA